MKNIWCLILFLGFAEIGYGQKAYKNLDDLFEPKDVLFYKIEDIKSYKAREKFKTGLQFIKNGKFDEAREVFLEADVLEPKSIVILNVIANMEKIEGNFDKAIALYDTIRKIDSTNVTTNINLSNCLHQTHYFSEAHRILIGSEKYLPEKNTQIKCIYYLNLASSFEKINDCDNAIQSAEKALLFSDTLEMIDALKKGIKKTKKKCQK